MTRAITREDIFKADAFAQTSGFERRTLFSENEKRQGKNKLSWIESNSGLLMTVGAIGERPICISVMIDVINGKNVVFYEATSLLVDWEMIEKFLSKNHPNFYAHHADADRFWDLFR